MTTLMPRWLNQDLTVKESLNAISCSLDLSVSDKPKATITMASADSLPGIHDFVEIFTDHGSAGLFRVVSSTYRYAGTCQLQLIGAVDTLSDEIWRETSIPLTRTAGGWMELVLAYQGVFWWQFGRCEMPSDVTLQINYSELWGLLEQIRTSQPGYMWEYDFTTTPWTLNLVRMPTTVESEFRVTRNVESAQITTSDQQMCNSLVFTVTDGNSDGTPLVQVYDDTASQAKYGRRTRCTDIKTEDIPHGLTAAQYAQQLLDEHSKPDYNIQISGADLSSLTGMTYDHMRLGYYCNVHLPEYGETIEERIVALSYPDVLGDPLRVRVSLSTELQSITGSIASAKSVAQAVKSVARGGGGGGGMKADKDSWSKILTDTIEAADGTGLKQLWQSGITMTAQGGVRIFSLYQGMDSLDKNKVEKGSVALELDAETGNVHIENGNLVVDGYVTASELSAQEARIDNLLNGTTTATTIRATNLYAGGSGGGSFHFHGSSVGLYSVEGTDGNAHQCLGIR